MRALLILACALSLPLLAACGTAPVDGTDAGMAGADAGPLPDGASADAAREGDAGSSDAASSDAATGLDAALPPDMPTCGAGDPPCPTHAPVCVEDTCLPCEPDTVVCLGDPTFTERYRCAADGSGLMFEELCFSDDGESPTCDPGVETCVPNCTPGARAGCASLAEYWQCGADGRYSERAACPTGQVCVTDGRCAPPAFDVLAELTAGSVEDLAAAALDSGTGVRVVAQWTDTDAASLGGDSYGVVTASWNPASGATTAPQLVNTTTAGVQRFSSLASFGSVVRSIWVNGPVFGPGPGSGTVETRQVGAGIPLGVVEPIGDGDFPDIAVLAEDLRVLAWGVGDFPSPSGQEIAVRFVPDVGATTSAAVLSFPEAGIPRAAIAPHALATGPGVVAATGRGGDVSIQCVSTDAIVVPATPLALTSTPQQELLGPMAGLPGGRAIVTWENTSERTTWVALLDDCAPMGAPISVGDGRVEPRAAAMWTDGRFAVGYRLSDSDPFVGGTYVDVYGPDGSLERERIRIGLPGDAAISLALAAWGDRQLAAVFSDGSRVYVQGYDLR